MPTLRSFPVLVVLVSCGAAVTATPEAAAPAAAVEAATAPVPAQVDEPAQAPEPAVDHSALDKLLREHVRDERVDYVAIRDRDRKALQDYLDAMAEVAVDELPDAERLAFWINLYNATMIAAVVDRLTAGYSTADRDYAVFKEPLARVGGKTVTLDHIEHEVLRKRFEEPRIHVALVCGARSCPPLLARAYRADDLDAVLEANMRRFVDGGDRNRIDREARRAALSKIFDWFKDDFGGADGVKRYVGRYAEVDLSRYAVFFLEYSWELNIAPPRQGRLLVARRAGTMSSGPLLDDVVYEQRQGDVLHALAERDGFVEVVVPGSGDQRGWVAASELAPAPWK